MLLLPGGGPHAETDKALPHRNLAEVAHACGTRWRAESQVSWAYSVTTRGKYIDTTQFGISTMELMRRSAQTLHSM